MITDRAQTEDPMRLLPCAALAVLAFPGLVAPAAAQQSSVRQEYDDVKNSLGFGRDRPPIDYTERAPLAVPPTYNLPPPGGADPEQLGVNDPDTAARRRALTDSRRPVPPTDPGAYASGRMARKYLIEPPSGMRDPDAVAADITHDGPGTAARAGVPKHRTHKHKQTAAE